MNIINSYINGVYYDYNGKANEVPKHVLRKGYHNSTMIDGKLYLNGYECINGRWKRSLKALFYKIF